MPSLNVISLLAFNASPLNSVSFNFLLWRRSFQQVSMDIRYLVLIKTGKKKKKTVEVSLVIHSHVGRWICLQSSAVFWSTSFHQDEHTGTYAKKKNHIVWKLMCNYSLEYLFLFVLCTLFVLLIEVYKKQTNKQSKTNNEKSKNDRDFALFRINKTTLCDIRFFFSFSVFCNLILNTLKNKKN